MQKGVDDIGYYIIPSKEDLERLNNNEKLEIEERREIAITTYSNWECYGCKQDFKPEKKIYLNSAKHRFRGSQCETCMSKKAVAEEL